MAELENGGKEAIKARACAAIDQRREDLIELASSVLRQPELGFKESRTARVVAERFGRLGLPFREGLAITGVKATLHGARPGPTLAILGELDAVVVSDHPYADPETGAAHACGHNGQIAALVGVAAGLVAAEAAAHLAGKVVFFAVPAEELVELEYRRQLRREGRIEFLGGKPELVRLGEFDDVHLAMMTHMTSSPSDGKACLPSTSNGVLVKVVRYLGRAAHAGGAPHQGVNALYAANLALSAINAIRETFRDEDTVRVHPIITKGGELVNVIPADVRLETYVRGKTVAAIEDANRKVDRALKAGALGVGGKVHISTLPGYMPLVTNQALADVFRPNIVRLVGEGEFREGGHRTGSTDMGDLSCIMPTIHPYTGGCTGLGHGSDYAIADPELAILNAAKAMAMTAIDLLWDDAALAASVLQRSHPQMSKNEYLAFMRRMASEIDYDGAAEV